MLLCTAFHYLVYIVELIMDERKRHRSCIAAPLVHKRRPAGEVGLEVAPFPLWGFSRTVREQRK